MTTTFVQSSVALMLASHFKMTKGQTIDQNWSLSGFSQPSKDTYKWKCEKDKKMIKTVLTKIQHQGRGSYNGHCDLNDDVKEFFECKDKNGYDRTNYFDSNDDECWLRYAKKHEDDEYGKSWNVNNYNGKNLKK